jgi:hypothetical protein
MSDTTAAPRVTWEYKVLDVETKGNVLVKLDRAKIEEELNRLGKLGWELVAATATSSHTGRSLSSVLILKRARRK